MTLAATDAELVAAFRKDGDPQALDELVRRHVGRVRAMIYAMVQDDAIADDLTQDVFVRALRSLANFRNESMFSTWLYRIAMNCVHGHRKTSGKQRATTVVDSDCSAVAADLRTDASAISQELEAAVGQAIEQLSPKLRAAVVLISINGLDASQAARIEGCTASTMTWRLYEARQQLKRLLHRHLEP